MKLYDNKRIAITINSIICGLGFTAFLFYNQSGTLGFKEIIILTMTAIISISITLIMVKIGNK